MVPQTEESIFVGALEIESSDERVAYLEKVCGGDMELKTRVGALLRRHEEAEGMLDVPPPGVAATPDTLQTQETIGALIDRYKLLELIGEGGFAAANDCQAKVGTDHTLSGCRSPGQLDRVTIFVQGPRITEVARSGEVQANVRRTILVKVLCPRGLRRDPGSQLGIAGHHGRDAWRRRLSLVGILLALVCCQRVGTVVQTLC